MKPQTVQIVRQGEATPYWFKFNPLYLRGRLKTPSCKTRKAAEQTERNYPHESSSPVPRRLRDDPLLQL